MYNTCRITIVSGTDKDKVFDFDKFMVSIGSLGTDDIKLASSSCVLPNHITIRQEDGKFFLLNNCFSSVRINGKTVTETELQDGDIIQFGAIGPKLLFKTDLIEIPSTNPDDFITLKSPEEEFPEVKQLDYLEELPFEIKENVIDEKLIEELKVEETFNPADFVTLKTPEEEFPDVKQLDYFEELPIKIKEDAKKENIIEITPLQPSKEEFLEKIQEKELKDDFFEITASAEEDINVLSVDVMSEFAGPEPIIDSPLVEKHIKSVAINNSNNVKEEFAETIEKKEGLTIKKAAYRRTTYGKNIDELNATVGMNPDNKLDTFIKKTFEPNKTTRQEKLNEMSSIIENHNLTKQNKSIENSDFKPKKSVSKNRAYQVSEKIEYIPVSIKQSRVKTFQDVTAAEPPYLAYVCVAGIISAIFFTIGLSISNNGISFFSLAPIVVAMIAVDSINNSYHITENRLTSSLFMAMGIVIAQTVLVVVLCLLGSLGDLGKYDIITYILNQIMFFSHQFVMCLILLFMVCVSTIIYVQTKFPESL